MTRNSTTTQSNDPTYDVSATAYNNLVGDYCSLSDTSSQTFTGIFRPTTGATWTIFKSGSDYYALDKNFNLTYGGATDEGSVDGADFAAVFNACAAVGGSIVLHVESAWSYSTTLNVSKSGTEVWMVQKGNYYLNYTGNTYAIRTTPDLAKGADTIAERIRFHNLYIIGNSSATYGFYIEDVQDFTMENCRIADFTNAAAYAVGVNSNLNSNTCNITIKDIRVQNCTFGIEGGASTYQVTIIGGQINGITAGAPAGSYGIFENATCRNMNVISVTVNEFDYCFRMEGEPWTLISCEIENGGTAGISVPNFIYQAAIIAPIFVACGSDMVIASARIFIADSVNGSFVTVITEKAGVPAAADFYNMRRCGFVYDTVNNRLYFQDSGGTMRFMGVT